MSGIKTVSRYSNFNDIATNMCCVNCGKIVIVGEIWFARHLRRGAGNGLNKTKFYCLECAKELNII